MKLSRRHFVGAGAATLAVSGRARADTYPSRPVRLIVGYTPGAITDFSARVIADALTQRLGQNVLVENRPGANSMIALADVAKSAPDGYTLMFGNGDATTMLPAVKPNVPYNIASDFTYVDRLVQFPGTLVVSSKLPVKTLAEFVAYAKANPGKLHYGSSGVGGSGHLQAVMFSQAAGIDTVHVPYRGAAPELTDLLSGILDFAFLTMATLASARGSDKIRFLATTAAVSPPSMPGLMTVGQAGYPQATLSDWFGILGPARMPADVVGKLNSAVHSALTDPEIVKRYTTVDLDPAPLSNDAFKQYVLDQFQVWKKLATDNHIHED